MNVLIFGTNYAPEETGIGPYTTGLAEYLVKEGHMVSMVTAFPSYPYWKIQDPYRRRLWMKELIDGVEILRCWNYVPKSQSSVRRALYELTFLLTALRGMGGAGNVDLVLGVIPTLAGGLLAKMASKRFGVPYGLIIQDLMGLASAQSGIRGGSRVAGLVSRMETSVVQTAASVGIISEGFRPHLLASAVDPLKIHRLRNWSLTGSCHENRGEMRSRFGFQTHEIVCLHAGNMGLKQGLLNVVECARLAADQEPSLRFVLMGEGSQRRSLEKATSGYGLKNITFLPVQSKEEFRRLLAAADILLLNQIAKISDMAFPSKLTSYFTAGRPVAAAIDADGESAQELRASGSGLIARPESPESLLAILSELAADGPRRARLGLFGMKFAAQKLSQSDANGLFEVFLKATQAGSVTR